MITVISPRGIADPNHKARACSPIPSSDRRWKNMNETLTNFRQAVADSTDLQDKVKAGADLVALGKENGFEFTQEELEAGWEELQESDEGLTEFELEVVAGGLGVRRSGMVS